MTIPTVTALPDAPTRADSATFDTRADAFMPALVTLATEINATVAATNAATAQVTLDAAATAADVVLTHADVVITHADVVLTHADVVSTGEDADATAADRVQTGLDRVATAADRVQTGEDTAAAAASAAAASAVTGIPVFGAGDAGKAMVVNPGETGYTLGSVQAPLESGTNIKTINSTSLLGSGDITVESFAAGDILLSARALSAPDWLPADGSAFLQASYPDLYAAIGILKSYPPSKLSDPATLPTGIGQAVAFSSDDTYMAVAHSTYPYITTYKRSGDTFSKLSDPATFPTGDGNGVAFSSDDTYMAVAHAASPYIIIFDYLGYDTSTLFIVPNVEADIETNAYIKP